MEKKQMIEVECLKNQSEDEIRRFFDQKNFIVSLEHSKDLLSGLQLIIDEEVDMKSGFKIILTDISDFESLLDNLIKEEKEKHIMTYKIKYEDLIKINFIKQLGEEGMEFIDKEVITKQRSVISYLIKKVGTNLLLGKSIMNVSLPTYIFDERSILDAYTYAFRLSPHFHDKASESTFLERLKIITSYALYSLHSSCTMLKPFNPILGETFQCKVNNSYFYIEQTSHHPPIYHYLIRNPKFTSFGYDNFSVSTGTNSITACRVGKYFTKFHDGVVYNYSYPSYTINGVVMGRRTVNFTGSLVIKDLSNDLMACVKFNPDERSVFGKIFGSKSNYPDYFKGFIARTPHVVYNPKKNSFTCDKNNIMANIEGEWSSFVKIDNKLYWEYGKLEPYPLEKMEFTLPSDSLYRDDLLLKKKGNEDLAQHAKIKLEEIQRKDRKLRERYREMNK